MKTNTLFLAVSAFFCSAQSFAQDVVLTTESHYNRGIDVVVNYANAPANEKDYIGIAPLGKDITGIPGGYTTTYAYLDNPTAQNGTTTIPGGNFGAVEDGYYYAVYCLKDGYDQIGNRSYFYLGDNLPIGEPKTLTLDEVTDDYTAIKYEDDLTWSTLITDVILDGVTCDSEEYVFDEGTLYLMKKLTGNHEIVVKAMNWQNSKLTLGGTNNVNSESTDNLIYYATSEKIISLNNANGVFNAAYIYSIQGNLVKQINIPAEMTSINLQTFANGTYLVRLVGATIDKTLKVVIVR